MKDKSCFNCRYAHVYPGTPDVFYLPNGDPGYPGDPPEAICTDPLASSLEEEYETIMYRFYDMLETSFRDLKKAGSRLTPDQLYRIELYLYREYNFAPYCPMYEYEKKRWEIEEEEEEEYYGHA